MCLLMYFEKLIYCTLPQREQIINCEICSKGWFELFCIDFLGHLLVRATT